MTSALNAKVEQTKKDHKVSEIYFSKQNFARFEIQRVWLENFYFLKDEKEKKYLLCSLVAEIQLLTRSDLNSGKNQHTSKCIPVSSSCL